VIITGYLTKLTNQQILNELRYLIIESLHQKGDEDETTSFNNKDLQFAEDDVIYLYSDGFVDQLGGPERKTFRSGRIKQLLLEIHHKPMYEQKALLEEACENWRQNIEQIDDIMVMEIMFTNA
jgi:serine phosphatase RsbU (regulator of sigma subunit)